MKAVVIQELCRGYGSRRGIQDVSLSIEVGEIFGFLGPNGSGKSTTIRILMGLLRANSGFANIFGRDCWKDGASLRSDVPSGMPTSSPDLASIARDDMLRTIAVVTPAGIHGFLDCVNDECD